MLRPAVAADARSLATVLVEGFGSFRAYAAEDWRPPRVEDITDLLAARLEQPAVWCLMAEHGARVAGYVALLPAAEARRPVSDPRLVHFWMLFVRAPWWGSGLATRLHEAACEAAAERGFTAMRLFTPAEQARARRFYEREGWTLVDGPYHDDDLGLDVVEYRRAIGAVAR